MKQNLRLGAALKALVLGAFAVSASISSAGVSWLYTQVDLSVAWSGGDPIDGQTSGSQSGHFVRQNSDTFIADNWTLNSEMSFSYAQYFYTSPPDPQAGSDINMWFVHNPGSDTSTHSVTFDYHLESIYDLQAPAVLNGYQFHTGIAPFQYARMERGTWDGVSFTPDSVNPLVLDFTAITGGQAVHTTPGTFRFIADFHAPFSVTSHAAMNQSGAWRHNVVVPEPASLMGLAACLAGMAARCSRKRS